MMRDPQSSLSSGKLQRGAGCAPAQRPWKATWILKLSGIIHVGCILLAALQPGLWTWALGTVLLNHLLITFGVMSPRSKLLGPNMTRLPAAAIQRNEVAITFDDGPDPEITPKVLDLLDQYRAKASFFCIATKAAAHPDLARDIVARGHSLENHTHSHPHAFATYGPLRLLREIQAAQSGICAITGIAPEFFRAPMGFRSPFLAPTVERAGLRYVTWTRRGYDVFAKDAAKVLKRLTQDLGAGDILLLHDGRSSDALRQSSITLELLPELLERLQEQGLKPVTLSQALDPVQA